MLGLGFYFPNISKSIFSKFISAGRTKVVEAPSLVPAELRDIFRTGLLEITVTDFPCAIFGRC